MVLVCLECAWADEQEVSLNVNRTGFQMFVERESMEIEMTQGVLAPAWEQSDLKEGSVLVTWAS